MINKIHRINGIIAYRTRGDGKNNIFLALLPAEMQSCSECFFNPHRYSCSAPRECINACGHERHPKKAMMWVLKSESFFEHMKEDKFSNDRYCKLIGDEELEKYPNDEDIIYVFAECHRHADHTAYEHHFKRWEYVSSPEKMFGKHLKQREIYIYETFSHHPQYLKFIELFNHFGLSRW